VSALVGPWAAAPAGPVRPAAPRAPRRPFWFQRTDRSDFLHLPLLSSRRAPLFFFAQALIGPADIVAVTAYAPPPSAMNTAIDAITLEYVRRRGMARPYAHEPACGQGGS
jgi:hypothetical protein